MLQRVNQEISQRQRALDAFEASETRKGAILNSALDCIVTIDRQCMILEFNPAAEKCFGYSRARALGRNFIDLFVRDSEKAFFHRNLDNEFTESGLPLNHHNRIQLTCIPAILNLGIKKGLGWLGADYLHFIHRPVACSAFIRYGFMRSRVIQALTWEKLKHLIIGGTLIKEL